MRIFVPGDAAAVAVGADEVAAAVGASVIRNGSRLNEVLVIKLDPGELDDATRARSADGIVAYSAFCPHAGCDVTGWLAEPKLIECVCHASHYDPRNGAAVVAGPATRPLPALPLRIDGGKVVVAKTFTSRVGISQG